MVARGRITLIGGVLVPLVIAGVAQAMYAVVSGQRGAAVSLAISLAGVSITAAIVVVVAGRIERKRRGMANLLDHADQGFLSVRADGTLAEERSAMATRLFGPYRPGQRLWEAIARHDPATAAWLDLCWASVLENEQPLARVLDQLPSELAIGDRRYRLEYRLAADAAAGDVIAVITDKTAELLRDRAEIAEHDLLRMIERMTRDRAWFGELSDDVDVRLGQLEAAAGQPASDKLRRELHTLKGNCALVGLTQIANSCHELEDRIAATGTVDTVAVRAIAHSWTELKTKLRRVAGAHPTATNDIGQDDLDELRDALSRGASLGMIDHIIRSWALERTRLRLERFAEQARALSIRLGKPEVDVEIHDYGVRLDATKLRPFWTAFSHVVRNAVDHGIEPPAERIAASKPERGRLTLVTRCEGNAAVIEIHDDGRGVDWDALRVRARDALRPYTTHNDLVAAMFSDGITTRPDITETSGRGVGLAVLRDVCVSLGGSIEVDSEAGRGVRFRFRLPLARRERMSSKIPRSYAITTRLQSGPKYPAPSGRATRT